jgi:branched-chain amino acid transport system permease protein
MRKLLSKLQIPVIIGAPILFLVFSNSTIIFLLYLVSLFVLYKCDLKLPIKLAIAAANLLIVIPVMGHSNTYYLDVLTEVGIYSVLAVGLNIVVGFAGLLDLGYVGFYATGAYVYAIFASTQASGFMGKSWSPISGNYFWLFLIIGMIVAAIVGVLLGLPVLRLKGDYLAIVTLGFGEIIRILLNNMDKPLNITNGPKGIVPISPPKLFGITLNKPIHFYFIVLVVLMLTIVIVNRLNNSKIGRAWTAIREDDLAARTMGIPLVKMKLFAFACGAAFAGMMGVIFAAKQNFIDPSSFGFMESIGILAMILLGGMGSIAGVITGATAVVVLQLQILKSLSGYLGDLSNAGIINLPSQLDPAKYEKLVFGLILIVMCILRPKGILPAKRKLHIAGKKIFGIVKKEKQPLV